TLSSGQAAFSISTLSVTTHSITAVYGGDVNFTTSTSPALSQVVNKASSTTAVTSSVNPSAFGQSVTLTATVTPNTATGTVQFFDGASPLGTTVTISGGSATFTTSSLAVGSHSITASYGGDLNFNSSTSAVLTQGVGVAASSTTVA